MAVGDEQPGEPRGGVTADGPDEAVNEGGAGGEENIKGQLASLQEHFQRLQQEAVDVETQQSHQIAVLNSTIQGMQRKNENLLEQLDDLTERLADRDGEISYLQNELESAISAGTLAEAGCAGQGAGTKGLHLSSCEQYRKQSLEAIVAVRQVLNRCSKMALQMGTEASS